MKMKTWTVYSSINGLFTGQIITAPISTLEANLPPTTRAIEGRYDRICQRFDLDTGAVVDHQPSQPHEDYEWRAENPDSVARANQRWRWIKKPEVVEIERRRAQALARIAALERKQLRPMRELQVDAGNAEAQRRIAEIDAEIAKLRGSLK